MRRRKTEETPLTPEALLERAMRGVARGGNLEEAEMDALSLAVRERLALGRVRFGDNSLQRHALDLLRESREEIVDFFVWGLLSQLNSGGEMDGDFEALFESAAMTFNDFEALRRRMEARVYGRKP